MESRALTALVALALILPGCNSVQKVQPPAATTVVSLSHDEAVALGNSVAIMESWPQRTNGEVEDRLPFASGLRPEHVENTLPKVKLWSPQFEHPFSRVQKLEVRQDRIQKLFELLLDPRNTPPGFLESLGGSDVLAFRFTFEDQFVIHVWCKNDGEWLLSTHPFELNSAQLADDLAEFFVLP